MRLLIDADQIGTLADRFRGVSMQLLNTAKTVRNDAWSVELSSRDTKVKTATEVTGRVATKYEAHAGSLDSQANELKQIESLVRGDHGDQAVLTAVPPTNWGAAPSVAPLQPLVTVPQPVVRSITDSIVPIDPMAVMPNAVNALQSIPTWITPTSSTVVQQVQAQLPEEMLPVKPKKKKGLFGRIFSAIGNFFKKLWNSVKALAKKLWTSLKTTLKGVWQALKNMSFKQLLLLGGTLALQFIPGLGQAAAGLIFGASNAARVVTIASAAYKVYNAGKAVYSTIKNGVRGIAGFIGLAGGISGALGSIGTLGTTIGGAAARIGDFATRAGAALTRVTTFVSSGRIFGVISEQLGNVAQRVAGAIGSIIPATGPIADIIRVVGRTASDVVSWVKTAINGVGKVITDARDWVDKSLAAVKAKYSSIVDGLTSSIGQVSPKLAELIKTTVLSHIDKGLLTITSSWDELRNAVTAQIAQALRIVRPIGALLTGNHALFQTTMQAELERTRLWTGRARVATEAVEGQLTPVADWTPTDAPTPETVPAADASTGTPVDTATTPAFTGSTTDAPQTLETDNVQTLPEAGTSLAPEAVLETSDTLPAAAATTITAPVDATPTPTSIDAVAPSVTETPNTPSVVVVGSAKTLDCVYPDLPVAKDPIAGAFPSDKPLPRCVLPTEPKLPKGLVVPTVNGLGSGILPVVDTAAIDALRNNLNITPNGPVATAWVSSISETQSSTMQGLLGLVDPTNEHSAMLRNLVAA
jgi:hypothetical protein